jgi:formylglycine-generating enzyme required for sulfatase activity
MEAVPAELRRNPLFFTLLAAIWLSRRDADPETRLPVTAGAIYRECVDMLIRRWTVKDLSGQSLRTLLNLPDDKALRRVLEHLAYQVHSTEQNVERDDKRGKPFDAGAVTNAVVAAGYKRVNEWLLRDLLAERAGIIYEEAPNRYRFVHRSFQEHLAAAHWCSQSPETIVDDLRSGPVLWRNVFNLLPDEVERRETSGSDGAVVDLWRVVEGLLPRAWQSPPHQDDPDWLLVFYAKRLVMNVLPEGDVRQEVYRARLKRAALAAVERGAGPAVERAELGQALSMLGDPRSGVGPIVAMDDIAWVDIDGVKQWTMVDRRGEEFGPFDIQPFRMSKYLVTYGQYKPFLADFSNPRWWKGLDAPDDHRRKHGDQEWKLDNHPAENVSWWDAQAYCAWLSAQLGHPTLYEWLKGEGVGHTSAPTWQNYPGVRLPTEWEWQYAAQRDTGWAYPYGPEFDAAKANVSETGIGQTSAVGIFPQGAASHWDESPDRQLMDMSGNVWEWCLNEYGTPENTALGGDAGRALRGGAFGNGDYGTRADDRGRINPYVRYTNGGFRLACSQKKSSDS